MSLATAKKHCRIYTEQDNDLIELYIRAAQRAVFDRTGVQPVAATFEATFHDWGCKLDELQLKAVPFRSVDEIKYIDEAGDEVIISDDTVWNAVRTYYGAWIDFRSDYTLPVVGDNFISDGVTVKFSAGYDPTDVSGSGDDPEFVIDEKVTMAILFLVGHWYNNREDIVDEEKFKVPKAFDFLADQLRVYA